MTAHAQSTRRRLLGGIGVLLWFPVWAEPLRVHLSDNRLRVAAPQMRFLTGRTLEHLQNGAPVAFAFQLSLWTDNPSTILLRDIERFVVSYDLWEERFSILKLGHPRRSVSHLRAEAAEVWCIDDLQIPAAGLPPDKPFWIRLDGRTEDPKETASLDGEGPVSLSRLIEIFSRRGRDEKPRWSAEAGPLRLADLERPSPAHPGGLRKKGQRESAAK